jgi:hypothetical protein
MKKSIKSIDEGQYIKRLQTLLFKFVRITKEIVEKMYMDAIEPYTEKVTTSKLYVLRKAETIEHSIL